MTRRIVAAALAAISLVMAGCGKEPPLGKNGEPVALRLGYFPNITHAQPLIGVPRHDYQKAIGADVTLQPQTFNAGPSVIEAIYAGHLDIAYVGPSPILNGFVQSKGEEVRVIAGSATNGVLVIGNKKRGIKKLEQLKGGRIATPQFANTQDISAKYFLINKLGAKLKSDGGETDVIPMANPDIETLFAKNQIDAAWVPEPWGSRIINKGLANLIVEEKDLWPESNFAMTNVIARRSFLEKHPKLVARFLEAHIQLTKELQTDPQSFASEINDELKRLTTKTLPPEVIAGSLKYTGFSYDPSPASFQLEFDMAKSVGLIKAESFNVTKLVADGPLKLALLAHDSISATTQTLSASSAATSTTEGSSL